jgi:molybdate transport system substrate-binding protein
VRARLGLLLLAVAVAAGCGSDDGRLRVSAASSLKDALPRYEPDARYSFAGSDELAAQIRAGARPDVFVSANVELPLALYREGLADPPALIATNRLVLAVPAGSKKVRALADLAKRGVTIAAGAPSVPAGSYTRQVLARLPKAQSGRILANVRSNEPDVSGIVGKLTQGAVDAGFVYATDVRAAGGSLRAIDLPARLRPRVTYGAALVKRAQHHERAVEFIAHLQKGRGQKVLVRAGFGPAPP